MKRKYEIGFIKGVSIEICKDGVLSYRDDPKQKARLGAALPCYSVSSIELAKSLMVTVAKLSYDNEYYIHDFTNEIEDIDRVSEMLYQAEQRFEKNKGAK